jgi:hypothetical protein
MGSDWIFGWLAGDGFEPPDQRTNKSFIRNSSRVRDRAEKADSLVGTIAETIGRLVSEALMLLSPLRQSTRGQYAAQIY